MRYKKPLLIWVIFFNIKINIHIYLSYDLQLIFIAYIFTEANWNGLFITKRNCYAVTKSCKDKIPLICRIFRSFAGLLYHRFEVYIRRSDNMWIWSYKLVRNVKPTYWAIDILREIYVSLKNELKDRYREKYDFRLNISVLREAGYLFIDQKLSSPSWI